jgi:hypothetical protein
LPPIFIDRSALVTVFGHAGTQKVANVYCYSKATEPTASDIDALATWWGNVGWGQVRNVMPSTFVLEEIRVRSTVPTLVYQRIITPTGTQVGARTGDTEQGVTSPINWGTATASRHSRGRTSYGPISEGDCNGEQLNTVITNLLSNLAAFLIVTHPNGNWVLSVGSRTLHVPYPVIAGVIKALTGTMATRLTRHG